MTDIDLRLRDELDVLFPVPRRPAGWEDVLERSHRPLLRRPLVLAFAAATLLLCSAAAVTAALGGFDAWLSGTPGEPASHEEQARFEAANGRTWSSFPGGTELRELIRTKVAGKEYVLFGFRSGPQLCLKLKAVSLGHSSQTHCVPQSALRRGPAIVPVDANDGFEDRHARPSASFSAGIAADGVSRVVVHAVGGEYDADTGGNAYLWVEDRPNTGERALRVTAVDANGSRVSTDLGASFGFFGGFAGEARVAKGPQHVQRRLPHPTISWLVRGEHRGKSFSDVPLTPQQSRAVDRDARLFKPDATLDVAVALQGRLCIVLLEGTSYGESCGPMDGMFKQRPFNVIASLRPEAAVIAGAAADGVPRLVAYLPDGERQRVPLRSNVFATLIDGRSFPLRLVAYDAHRRVVGVQTLTNPMLQQIPPPAANRLRPMLRVRGPHGVTATLRVGRRVGQFRCWRVDFSTGQSPGSCSLVTSGAIWIDGVQPAGRDLFVLGGAPWNVDVVRLQFADGTRRRMRPVAGHFLFAIPASELRPTQQFANVYAELEGGLVMHRRGFVFKALR